MCKCMKNIMLGMLCVYVTCYVCIIYSVDVHVYCVFAVYAHGI